MEGKAAYFEPLRTMLAHAVRCCAFLVDHFDDVSIVHMYVCTEAVRRRNSRHNGYLLRSTHQVQSALHLLDKWRAATRGTARPAQPRYTHSRTGRKFTKTDIAGRSEVLVVILVKTYSTPTVAPGRGRGSLFIIVGRVKGGFLRARLMRGIG